jgi:hypothetical protein
MSRRLDRNAPQVGARMPPVLWRGRGHGVAPSRTRPGSEAAQAACGAARQRRPALSPVGTGMGRTDGYLPRGPPGPAHFDGLRVRANAGDWPAVERLAELLARQGRSEEAERLRRFGLNTDGSIACA